MSDCQCRFFSATDAAYEAARATVDAAMGYPDADTATIWQPAASAPHDADGNAMLALWCELADIAAVAAVLPTLAEIDEAEYRARLPEDVEE